MMTFEDKEKHTSDLNSCKVCGDEVYIIHYGALSCNSCKTFFSRYGLKSETASKCLFNDQCKINIQKRRLCLSYRLMKCFKVGMNSSFIRKTHKISKNDCSLKNTKNTPMVLFSSIILTSPVPTLDLLRQDRLTLSTSEWALLSNVVHDYDTFSVIRQIRDVIKEMSKLSIQLPSNSMRPFAVIESIIISIQPLIRSLPDFQILTISEQHSLLERNLQDITGFNCGFVSREAGLVDSSQFKNYETSIYGSETVIRAKRLENQLDPDCTVIKLITIILSFSSNCLILNVPKNFHNNIFLSGTFPLLGSQNVYVELLWKYMMYRYGYRDTDLIKQVLDALDHLIKAYMGSQTHHVFMENAFDEDKHSFITDLNENIPLWGNS